MSRAKLPPSTLFAPINALWKRHKLVISINKIRNFFFEDVK